MEPASGPELLARLRADPDTAGLIGELPGEPPVHLVGGAVRDVLLGRGVREFDLVTEGDVEALAARLAGAAVVHGRFGTASLRRDGRRIDLARARRERYPSPGALPEVEPAPLAEDLGRRDFTVNAIALTLTGPAAGELRAVDGALRDLAEGRLRVLHDRSFLEDPTRLLRLARYAARLQFDPDARTGELIGEALAAGALATISGDRLGAELRLLLAEPDPAAALATLDGLGIAAAIEPGFGLRDTDPSLVRAARDLLADAARDGTLVLGLALDGVPEPRREPLLSRLGWPAEERDAALALAEGRRRLAVRLEHADRPSEIAVAVHGASPELIAAAGATAGSDGRRAAERWRDELRHVRPAIGGADLLAAGVPSGPEVGAGLRAALAAKLDGTADGPEEELAEALRALGRGEAEG